MGTSTLTQPARLAALEASGLLRHDNPRDRLNLLCATAAAILAAPIVEVNVLTGTQQITVGRYPPAAQWGVVDVAESGCQVVVEAGRAVVVPDMREHPVMCALPVVKSGEARAYLGVPITHDGMVIGSFCALDVKTRQWSSWDECNLRELARLAGLAAA